MCLSVRSRRRKKIKLSTGTDLLTGSVFVKGISMSLSIIPTERFRTYLRSIVKDGDKSEYTKGFNDAIKVIEQGIEKIEWKEWEECMDDDVDSNAVLAVEQMVDDYIKNDLVQDGDDHEYITLCRDCFKRVCADWYAIGGQQPVISTRSLVEDDNLWNENGTWNEEQ